ncbi:MAG TPA: hypothetical protein VH186_21130 [Chloroflexia bacterium]|nr:hypothetical protein [Chloroflexia bacterium]
MLDTLSTKAKNLLERRPRDLRGQPSKLAELEEILAKFNCPVDHPIVPFQLALGGYFYFVRGQETNLKKLGVPNDAYIDNYMQHWFCECLEENSTQCEIVMDENGQIYYNAYGGYEVVSFSSASVFIENDAMFDSLFDLSPSWYRIQMGFDLEQAKHLEIELCAAGFEPLAEATDEFSGWWISSETIINRFRIWEPKKLWFSFSVFGLKVENIEEVEKKVFNKLDIQPVNKDIGMIKMRS